MKEKKSKSLFLMNMLDRTCRLFEIFIAAILLVIVFVKIFDTSFLLLGWDITFLTHDFENILARIFNLVIGIEFTKMLVKHTPETVLDVLLFVIARQLIIVVEGSVNMLLGVSAIAGIFAIKKYLVDAKKQRNKELVLEAPDELDYNKKL